MKSDFAIILTTLFVGCFAFSVLINLILLKFAQTLGVRGKEAGQVRWNPNIKPSLGGISFFLIFLFAIVFVNLSPFNQSGFNIPLIGLFIATTLAFLMGLADDAFNTQPLVKIITQVVCGLILVLSGNGIYVFDNAFLNTGVTILWVVALMNSINMLDNMDGITTIVSNVVIMFFIIVCVRTGMTNTALCLINVCVLACLTGFLIFNFHPSKMFMGDTGSQFLGLFIAYSSIQIVWNNSLIPSAINPILFNTVIVILLLIIPLTDTTTVVVNRLMAGKSPFIGGKDHTTHHLFFRGITEKRIFLLYFIISLIAISLAYQLIFHFNYLLLWISLSYICIVFVTLYISTILKKAGKST
ncbi:MAG: MraY family glycosyltransferase [Bacteroidota bacterium]|jgi:UDP-GlcNAc:undecaprenyl-phosphate GlcNAc-1-phosphate transferase|nr:undecaprenyl/decaprenyl-phosphate alpha-N-acetylglucosaminyl 1-phosphate transferase [Bacteroidota bacterium]MCA6444715.1 undecaprenyl/decaprenyl-phosphate alpha-N-acetylglucosaminyl 1-phosphate transferase [Bacteroidota bacterium]